MMSFTRAGPISAVSRAMFVIDRQLPRVRAIGKPNFAVGVPMRRSQQAAMAAPPPAQTPVQTADSHGTGPLDRLAFRAIGPAAPSGRIDDLAVLESDPSTFYVATATSGIYKTTNNGTTLIEIFFEVGTDPDVAEDGLTVTTERGGSAASRDMGDDDIVDAEIVDE